MLSKPSRRRLGVAAGLLAVPVLVLPAPAAAIPGQQVVFEHLYVTNSALREPAPAPGSAGLFEVEDSSKISPAGAVEAGRGARGLVFARVNTDRFAYVVSQLSSAPNDKRVGRIDRYRVGGNGALIPLGATATDQPFGIATSPNRRTIYVTNFEDEDGPQGTGSLSAFRVEPDGGLTLINTVDSGTNHPKFLAVAPNGRFVYVANGTPNAPAPGTLTGYPIEADGSIGKTPVAQQPIGESGHRVVITPNGSFVYVTNQEFGTPVGDPDVYGFRIGLDGGLTPIPGTPVESGVLTEGTAISPDGKRLYVVALGSVQPLTEPPVADGEIRSFTIGADGGLTAAGTVAFGFDPVDMAFGWNGDRLYVSDFSGRVDGQGRGTVSSFNVDDNGKLDHVHTVLSQGFDPGTQSVFVPPRIDVT